MTWLRLITVWPFSYLVGLIIGLLVASAFWLWSTELRDHLHPVGINLFLGGWVILIATTYEASNKSTPTRLQLWVRRGSIALGITLSATSSTFFATPPEKDGSISMIGRFSSFFQNTISDLG